MQTYGAQAFAAQAFQAVSLAGEPEGTPEPIIGRLVVNRTGGTASGIGRTGGTVES